LRGNCISLHDDLPIFRYYDLYSPALDWMLQCLAHNNRSKATLMPILEKYKVMGDALTLNHIIRNFHPDVAAKECLLFAELIKSRSEEHTSELQSREKP